MSDTGITTSNCTVSTPLEAHSVYFDNNWTYTDNQSWGYHIKLPPNPSAPLPEPLKQIVDHEWEKCWKDSKVKCFSDKDQMIEYADSLDSCTIYWYEEISKEVKHKSVLHRFSKCTTAGFILSGNDNETTILLVEE